MARVTIVPWSLILGKVTDHAAMHHWLHHHCGVGYGTCGNGIWFVNMAAAQRFRHRFDLDKIDGLATEC